MPEANRSLWSRIVDALELRQYLRPRDFVIAGLLVSLLMPLILVSPRPSPGIQKYWLLHVVELGGPVHIVKNVDSYEFEHDAKSPGDLFTVAHRHWQSRPLAVWLGWALSQPFRAGGMPTRVAMTPEAGNVLVQKPPYPAEYNAYSPEYAGFILLNWLLLVGSVILFKPLLRGKSYLDAWVLLPVSMLIVNMVTRAFFWTPHTQIFNVVLPVATMTLLRPLLPRAKTLTVRDTALIGAVFGILAMAYGAFAVTAGAAALVILLGDGWQTLKREVRRRSILSATLIAAFFAPMLLWIGIVILVTGAFYSPETQRYHEFVWLYERLPEGLGVYLPLVARNVKTYAEFALHASMIPALLIAGLVVFLFRKTVEGYATRPENDTRRAVMFFMAADSAFYVSMGFYAERIAWTIVPGVLVVLGLQLRLADETLTGRKRLAFRAIVFALAVGSVIHVIFRKGPFA
ncbi:MAG TPA: hypothetical protein VM053_08810 [Gemmatimonadaceae bacterium]|nr:hypothetical protein [Gemmatimonadaceae bacterium]